MKERNGEGKGTAEANRGYKQPASDVLEAQGRAVQEGSRARSSVRRGGGAHNFLRPRQALRVLQCRKVGLSRTLTHHLQTAFPFKSLSSPVLAFE